MSQRFTSARGIAAGLAACAALHAPAVTASPLRFAAPFVAYEMGALPLGVGAADLNGDGRADLVAANAGESAVSVRLALPDGTFGPQAEFATAASPWAVALGDLDGDGTVDGAAVCYAAGSVVLLHGNGDGTFAPLGALATPPEPKSIALAALDGEPRLDLVTLNSPYNYPPGSLSVWLATGPGTFGERRDIVPPGKPVSFRAVDTTGDGRAELVIAHTDPEGVSILRNLGDGTFATAATLPLAGTPLGLAVGDWNGDGRVDGAVYTERVELGLLVQRLAVWVGDADGSMVPMPEVFAVAYGAGLETGDLDGDGHADLVSIGTSVDVHLGRGDGTFGFPRPHEAGVQAWSGLVRDLDGDGRLDVAVAASESWAVAILHGNGDGSLGVASVPSAPSPQAVACADLDADGAADLVLPSPAVDRVAVHRGRGDGSFAAPREFPVPPEPSSAAVADFDEDGAPDLAVVTFVEATGGRFAWLRGDGRGGFAPAADVPLAGPATVVVCGDWNGDGHADVAAAEWTASWPEDGTVETFLGAGDGSFAPGAVHAVGPLPLGLAAGDVDGDSHVDLVASYRQAADAAVGGVTLLHGDGQGGFGSRADLAGGVEPRAVALGDLDEDGAADIVVANSNFARPGPASISVFRGRGSGGFDPPVEYPTGIETFGLALADLDGDGWLDAAATNAGANTLTAYHGRGDAGFDARLDWGTGNRPIGVAAADLDGDGRVDLVTANSGAASFTVLANRSATTPVVVTDLAAAACGAGLCLEWRLADAARRTLGGIDVERAADPAGPWTRLTVTPLAASPRGSFADAGWNGESAWYRLRLLGADGSLSYGGPIASPLAGSAALLALEPPRTDGEAVRIEYTTARGAADLFLAVVDVRGRIVRALARGACAAGRHQVLWDRRDTHGALVARGVYWVHARADGRSATRRLVLPHR